MKKLLLIAVVVVGASALVFAGRAGGFGQRGFANGPGWMHPGPGGRGQFGPLCNLQDAGTPPMMLGVLNLTDEQKEAIAKLVGDSRVKLHADIEAVLTPEQVEKLEQLRDDVATRTFAALDLTEEQEAAIAEIRENARAEAEAAETPEARQEIMQAAHDEIMAVLTDEQIEKLEQLPPGAPRGRGGPGKGHMGTGPRGPYAGPDGPLTALDLTEEQEAAIADIRENARAEAQTAETREARQEIMQAAHDEIMAVLTDEQIEKLEQLPPGAPRGRGGPGKGHMGTGPRGPYAGPDGPLTALDLTEEQEAAIADIRENARAEAQTAETREARQEIMQTAHEEVLSVLTDEQIEKLEQSCPRTPWGQGGPGRGRW